MADVITRLKLESGEYDSKIKRATQGLLQMEQECRKAGQSLNSVSAENMKYVQSLGQMQTVSTTTRGKLGELTSAFTELSVQYKRLTDEEKKGDFGRALSSSLDQLKTRINETKADLADIDRQLGNVSNKGGGLFSGGVLGGAKNAMGMLGMSPAMLTGIGAATAGFAALKGAIESNIETARNFELSMSQLSSLTGKTGDDLNKLKEYAIELGSKSTLTASQVADAFKMIGSQQPQLLESSEALKAVTKNAITLAEAAGIDLATAAQTLSTSINQFGGDSSRAAEFINILAAASQKGAGDIGWLGEAVTKSGTTAKAVGTDYNELVANLEQLAKAGYDASTAGTALRSIIMSLEKQSNDEYKPSVVGLTQAFQNLNAAQLTLTQYQETAGKMFAAQAKALAENADEAARLKDEITGTNTAEEQAKTNSDNLQGSLLSLSSAWEGLNLHINSSNGFLKSCVDWLKDVVTWADQAFTAAGRAQRQLAQMQGGGNGQPTKVDQQISALGGSNYKQVAYSAELNRYDKQIADLQTKINNGGKWESKTKHGFYHYESTRVLQDQLAAVKTMRDEYASRGKQLIEAATKNIADTTGDIGKPSVTLDVDADTDAATKSIKELQSEIKKLAKLRDEAANKGDTKLRDQYNAQIKATRAQIKQMQGTTTTTHHTTPQEQASKSISNAEAKYQDALALAAKQMEAGTITDAEYKKHLLSQQQRLYDAYGSAYQTYADPKYKEAQAKAADEIVRLGGEVKSATEAQEAQKKAARELEQSMKKLSDAQAETAQAIAGNDLKGYYAAQKKVAAGGPADQTTAFTYTTGNLDAFIGSLKERISQSDVGTDLYNALTKQLADATTLGSLMEVAVKNGIDTAQFDPAELWGKIFSQNPGDYIEDSTWQNLVDTINEKLEEMDVAPIKLNFSTGGVRQEAKKMNDDWKQAASAIQSVGQAMASIEDPAAKVMGTIAQAIASIALGAGQAIAQASTGAAGGPWGWIAFAAAATATMISTIASVKSATAGSYEHGGIVPGNSWHGDNLTANVNSGELILNRAQQNNLASQLEGGGMGALQLSATIRGEDIKLALNNNSRRRGHGEYVTSNFR